MTWRRGSRAGGPLQACGKDVCDQLADSTWQQEPASTSGDCVVCDLDLPLHQSQLDLYPDRIIHTRIPPLTSRQWTSVPLESHQHHHTAKRLPAPQHRRPPPPSDLRSIATSCYSCAPLLLVCSRWELALQGATNAQDRTHDPAVFLTQLVRAASSPNPVVVARNRGCDRGPRVCYAIDNNSIRPADIDERRHADARGI